MSTLSLRLPDSIHKNAREIAEQEGISVNQFIASAVAEKLAALAAADYIESRAKRANSKAFKAALDAVPMAEVEAGDE